MSIGRLVAPRENQSLYLEQGDYGKDAYTKIWYARPPGTDLVANLERHVVIENPDGTITVAPSILVRNRQDRWHGFIENGIWRKKL